MPDVKSTHFGSYGDGLVHGTSGLRRDARHGVLRYGRDAWAVRTGTVIAARAASCAVARVVTRNNNSG